MKRLHIHIGRLALPALVGALSGLCAPPALAAVTDIANAPLASASNLAVKPNLLFILDDSGSMQFDAMPDNAETQQGASERKYWDTSYNCKWRSDTTGLLGNHCDRVDPPFGAADFNGLYYNPQVTYAPPKQADGTIAKNFDNGTTAVGLSHGNWNAVACDPFPSGTTCDNFYTVSLNGYSFHDYYTTGSTAFDSNGGYVIGTDRGIQTWTNAGVKNWYGAAGATTFNVQASFPEIVYCRNASDATSICRRNGFSDTTDKTQTGNPFRYTSAIGVSMQTGTNPPTSHNGYPESPPLNEFWRLASNTTITVTTSNAHGIAAISASGQYPAYAAPFKIIPRTNTGTTTATALDWISNGTTAATGSNSCVTDGTCIVTVTGTNQFTYLNSKNGQQLAAAGPNSMISTAFGSYDLIVPLQTDSATPTGSGTTTSTTVYVTAPNHGLIAGDQINMFLLVSNTNILCTNPAKVTVLATPAPTANTFAFTTTGCSTIKKSIAATGYFNKTAFYNIPKLMPGNPLYYTIQPVEYCSDEYLNNCTAATAPSGGFIYPAPVRFCLTEFDANRWDTPTGKDRTNVAFRCQKKYNPASPSSTYLGYIYPRYGKFLRGNVTAGTGTSNTLVGTTTTYNGRYLRKDCAGNASASPTGVCTGNEELTNFANWFAFYRHRMPMMKTSASIAFSPIDKAYRVGFLTINAAVPPGSNDFLGISDFTTTQKSTWYADLFAQTPGGSTPLPMALSRAGRYFAGKNDGINKQMVQGQSQDPIQYSCQQNFALLTTDGYWNQRAGKNLSDTSTSSSTDSIGNQDNTFSCAANDPHAVCGGAWDGYSSATSWTDANGNTFSSSGTLADVARYYYNTDLRSSALGNANGALGTDVSTDNVPNSTEDPATWQHMNTFGLGMSEGFMNWRKDWESAGSGDYFKIANSQSGCSWDANCRWPVPGPQSPAALDDLWHAAVNGHGDFFYARDTAAVQDGITTALNNLNTRNASGSAAATSTPNITSSDRMIFLSSYTTVQWNGDIQAQQIDPNTGAIQSGVLWSAKAQVQAQTGASTDTRSIYTFSASGSNRMKSFTYANLNTTVTTATGPMGTVTLAAETPWFDNKCTPLTNMTQCPSLDPFTQLPIINLGVNMVNFLRGQNQYEATIFRDRAFALGDTINAAPLFVGKPRLNFVDNVTPTYQVWAAQSSIANRTPTLYAGANDGMLHAFNTNTGNELWAYIPRMVLPNLWQLADSNYATKHTYYVDGSPTTMDIFDGTTWRTILVGGLNSGGRGYYAIDVTNPTAPQVLWEFCADSTMCIVSDPDLGLTYGNPIITKNANGAWVVLLTSGYNNGTNTASGTPNTPIGSGLGLLYVLDPLTGKVLQKISTGVGTAASPSGLGKINAWIDFYATDNTSSAVYGADLQGNIWEFDMTVWPIPAPKKIGQALDGSGRVQPITTKPELGLINDTYTVLYVGTGRYLGLTDLTDPATQTPPGTDAWQNSLYAFKISPHDSSDKLYGNLRNGANMLVKQNITIVSPTTRTTSANSVNWTTSNGWYLDFNPSNDSPGERVNIDPQLVLGTLIVPTNVPGGGACSVGGDSWFYQFDYKTGQYVSSTPSNLVGVKIQGAMSVGVSVFQLQSNAIGIVDMRSDAKPTQPGFNGAPASATAKRSGWRELTPH